ncbi:hypothetical protein SDC9_95058 [bioreactor metagenome]|uniref:Uncharacterized protein n=1 Tax=bioreactor metagenome TaxID=1076179 RepID=A0A645AF77_9ZZZZ
MPAALLCSLDATIEPEKALNAISPVAVKPRPAPLPAAACTRPLKVVFTAIERAVTPAAAPPALMVIVPLQLLPKTKSAVALSL